MLETLAKVVFVSLPSFAAGACFVAILVINFSNVALRYVWSAPLTWAEEAMICLTLWDVALMFPVLTFQHAHLRINLLDDAIGARGRVVRGAIEAVALVAASAFVACQSYKVIELYFNSGETTTAARMPMWIYQGSFLVGFLLMALAGVFSLFAVRRETGEIGAEPKGGIE